MRITQTAHENLLPKISFINKKQFGKYKGLVNPKSITAHYETYLATVGKSHNMQLTNLDIFKVDDFII